MPRVKVYYRITKGPGKKYIVLLHGLGGDLCVWDPAAKILCKEYSILAVDIRGHGFSDRPERKKDYKIEESAKDVCNILEKEGIKDFVMVGHCYGALVSMKFQELFPKKAKAYVLINGAYKSMHGKKIRALTRISFLLQGIDRKKKVHRDFTVYKGGGDWNIRRIFDDIIATGPKPYLNTMKNLEDMDFEKSLLSITVPTLFITGGKDSVYNKSISVKMQKLVKNSRIKIMEQQNHITPINDHQGLAAEILWFLAKVYK